MCDDWTTTVIRSRIEEIPDVREALLRRLRGAGWTKESCLPVLLALDECLVNAIDHGNAGDARKVVTVRYTLAGERVTVEVTDEGDGFRPAEIPPGDELPPYAGSGRGLFLIRSLMDEVAFSDAGNRVTFAKRRSPAG